MMRNRCLNTKKREDVKNLFKKMIADQHAVQSHIREYGTLKGFADDSIVFAKPISLI